MYFTVVPVAFVEGCQYWFDGFSSPPLLLFLTSLSSEIRIQCQEVNMDISFELSIQSIVNSIKQ